MSDALALVPGIVGGGEFRSGSRKNSLRRLADEVCARTRMGSRKAPAALLPARDLSRGSSSKLSNLIRMDLSYFPEAHSRGGEARTPGSDQPCGAHAGVLDLTFYNCREISQYVRA